MPLPKLVTPTLQRLIDAIRDDEAGDADEALEDALDRLDTPAARAVLTRGVIALRDAGRLRPRLAAVAIVDLAGRSRAFVRASLLEAAAVAAGAARTPGGLVVARELAAWPEPATTPRTTGCSAVAGGGGLQAEPLLLSISARAEAHPMV